MSTSEAIHAHASVARILEKQGKPEEAIGELQKAAVIAETGDPPASPAQRAWLWNQVGNLLEKLGRADDALDAFRRAAAVAAPPPKPPSP